VDHIFQLGCWWYVKVGVQIARQLMVLAVAMKWHYKYTALPVSIFKEQNKTEQISLHAVSFMLQQNSNPYQKFPF